MKLKNQAIEFLRELLKHGSMRVCDIEARALDRGIRWRTLRRASDELCLVKRPSTDLRWHWSLPSEVSKLSKSVSATNAAVKPKQRSTPEMWRAFLASHNTKIIPIGSNDE